MSVEVKVPVLPESVSDAMIATWHKNVGDTVSRDENLVDLETDKVVLEVPAPTNGVITEILEDAGATVTSDQILARIDESAATSTKKEKTSDDTETSNDTENKNKKDKDESNNKTPSTSGSGISPAARKLAEENDIDIDQVKGSGRDGRITKADVLSHNQQSTSSPSINLSGSRPEKRVPMTRLRSRIAERMVEAQSTAAMLTSFNEVNLKAVMDIRKQYKESFEKKHGTKLGLMSFFVTACVEALKEHPVINASVEEQDIVYHGYYDVGIAVSTERGLVVPVLRNADQMSIADIESTIVNYAEKARSGGIDISDLQGGTFTITNGGVFGSLVSTPILNPPQSAILGMHTIKERPIVENGEIVARPMMYIALTYDHRIIDGKDAVLFLVAVKNALEDPTRLLLQL